MKILFISNLNDKTRFENILKERTRNIINPSQKFFSLVVIGLDNNPNVSNITCISQTPVSSSSHGKYMWKKESSTNGKVKFIYPGFLNGKISRHLTSSIGTLVQLLKWIGHNRNDKNKIVILDPLIFSSYYISQVICFLFRVKTISFYTDLIEYSNPKTEVKLVSKITQGLGLVSKRIRSLSDSYIFLTKFMNEKENIKGKPNIIIECITDIEKNIHKKEKNEKFTVVYAGGIYAKYGLDYLVNAFTYDELKDVDLVVYGEGEYKDQLISKSNIYSNIKYGGYKNVSDVFIDQVNADLLINPRPSNAEYTLYSFPSKTAEYLTTGTPTISTKLGGIGDEYFNFLIPLENEDEQGVVRLITMLKEMNPISLETIGKKGREFIIEEKNSSVQSNKIVAFAKELLDE